MKWFDRFLYFICFPIVAIGSILSPLTNDVRIFYGVEYLCWKYLSDFPSNINYFFEIKPIGNHIINYILVVFTNFFVPFQNHTGQEILIKTVAVAIAIVACWYFSKNILKIKYGFLLSFFGIYCGLNLNILQAEWWAVITAMIACALFVEENKLWHCFAGALLIWVLLFKGTTGALIISAICIVMIVQKNIDWVRGGIGFVTMGISFYAAHLLFWPTLISDIMIAPVLSHVGEYAWLGQIYVTVVALAISMSIYIPVVGLGLIYGIAWLNKHRKDPRALWLVGCWLAPLIVVWLQSESFGYQYFVFIIPSIISLVLYEKETPKERPGKKLKRENLVAATVIILFIMYACLYSPISKYGNEERQMNNYFWEQSNKINEQFDLVNQPSVLYLDTGSGPYYTNGVNSSCRYVAPLVIQRANPNRTQILELPQNQEEFLCIMNYSGRYVVADGVIGPNDSWFGNDTYQKAAIIQKLRNEYVSAHSGGWEIYQRKNSSEITNLT
jgi:hypothetical protein